MEFPNFELSTHRLLIMDFCSKQDYLRLIFVVFQLPQLEYVMVVVMADSEIIIVLFIQQQQQQPQQQRRDHVLIIMILHICISNNKKKTRPQIIISNKL